MIEKNLTVIIPYYNGENTIKNLIESIPKEIPIIIVDDMSDRPLLGGWSDDSKIKIIRLSRKGYFAGAVNTGIQACNTDVLVLNQDVWFENSTWIAILDQYHSRYAMIGERVRGYHPTFGEIGYIHGTFMWLRRDAIDDVGLLNKKDYPLWGATAEWQLRAARYGYSVLPLDEIEGFYHGRSKQESFGSSIKQLLIKEPQNKDLLIRTPPILSVIVPCYNYGHYIKDCISSLIGGVSSLGPMKAQTLQSFEIIIVDDASTDNSWEKILEVTKPEQGIRSYRLERNVGTARALNFAIERAVGKYITFLSADDMREYDSLERLVQVCEDNPHSFAYDDMWLVHTRLRIKQWKMEEYDFDKLLYQNQVHAGIVYPKAAWTEVNGYPAIMNDGREDWAFNIALGLAGWCGIHVKEFGYLYRREGQNRTETNTSGYYREYFLDKIRSLYPKVYGGYRPMACCGKGNNAARSNSPDKKMLVADSENGAMRMADSIGQVGMVRLAYLGKQSISTWYGDTTYASYEFGIDKKRSWVDRRDVGERGGKTGFLSKKDQNGNWIFEDASESTTIIQPEKELVAEAQIQTPTEKHRNSTTIIQFPKATIHATATVVVKEPELDFPNPADLNVVELKVLDLTKEQWEAVYKSELAGRSRKGAILFLEEKLVSFGSDN